MQKDELLLVIGLSFIVLLGMALAANEALFVQPRLKRVYEKGWVEGYRASDENETWTTGDDEIEFLATDCKHCGSDNY